MAKDPAFLFYPGDYISGTMHLDFECKGAYFDLLMLQFNKDRMTIHMIKQVLGHKYEHIWSLISDKFREENGFYWNERLRVEKENRLNFCKSRKTNRNGGIDMIEHMYPHMEDVNINKDINELRKEGMGGKPIWNKMPGEQEMSLLLPEIKSGAVIQLFYHTQRKEISTEEVLILWDIFKKQNLTGEHFYNTPNAVFSHFINWSKTQRINGTHQQSASNGSGKLGTSDARIKKAREF